MFYINSADSNRIWTKSDIASNQMSVGVLSHTNLRELPHNPSCLPAKPCPLNGRGYANRDPAGGEVQNEGEWSGCGTAATIEASF